ncbi:hypothetical protein CsSME_00046341 [Camellia sinensis var. sinensis]
MAKVATQGPVSSSALHFGGGASKVSTAVKRKTPSELRGEQLKRKNVVELVDESPAAELGFLENTTGIVCGLKKPDLSKNRRYIDTRMDEVYPVRKSSIRLRMLSRKENAKENSPVEHNGSLKSCSVPSDLAAKSQSQLSHPEDSFASGTRDGTVQACKTTEKCSENTFRSVTELSAGGEKLSGRETVDLDKALKGLVAHEPPPRSSLASDSSERKGDFTLGNLCSEFHIPGRKSPLDFTLKTTMRVVSSSSVNWFHRLIACGAYSGGAQFTSAFQVGCSEGQKMSSSLEFTSTTQVVNPRALHSWVYPQSSLPPSIISALTLSSAEGVQMDFLSKRQLAWEDAFRSLYYMLRKSVCEIFYVCTAQFVVMFIGDDGSKESKRTCNAYISQSTRSLRSLLREHDISFSMPLCYSKVEQTTTEDLVELSEMEKHNLGQIRRQSSMSNVDNSPQSLLAFNGNQNVHGLYDFLLNYRFLLTSLTSMDVPVLYSPVPFQNAALSCPEVRCKEVRRADNISFPLKEFNMKDESSSSGFCYSIEIKDAYLPPWVISSFCEAMCSEGMSFEARLVMELRNHNVTDSTKGLVHSNGMSYSHRIGTHGTKVQSSLCFVTESTTTGLNVGFETICQKVNPHQPTAVEGLQESRSAFGISNTIFSLHLRSAFLKGLKYSNGSYTASVSSV